MWGNRILLIFLVLTICILVTIEGAALKTCGEENTFGGTFVSPLGRGRGLTKEKIVQIGISTVLDSNDYQFYAKYLDTLRKRRAGGGRNFKKFETKEQVLKMMGEEGSKIIVKNYAKGGRQLTGRPFCKCSKQQTSAQPLPQTTEAPQKIPRDGQIFNFDPRKPVRRISN